MMTLTELKTLQAEIHQLAHAKGWYEARDLADPCVRESMLALTHSELSEALECIREGDTGVWYDRAEPPGRELVPVHYLTGRLLKPCGLGSELADVVIRTLDFAAAFDIELTPDLSPPGPEARKGCTPTHAAAVICYLHREVARDTPDSHSHLLKFCWRLAWIHDIDLGACVRQKHAFNATRPHRHGGKAL